MLKIGVTGGIGSGKTTVCRIFETLGIPVFNADYESKKIIQTDEPIIEQVKQKFGDEIYSGNILDKKKLAEIVFNDTEKLQALNSITHPAVVRKFEEWTRQYKDAPYVIKEAALIFEAGSNTGLDKVIMVSAPESVRIQRIKERDGISEDNIRARMENQWPEDKKLRLSDFTIENDGDQMLIPQVWSLHQQLTAIALTISRLNI